VKFLGEARRRFGDVRLRVLEIPPAVLFLQLFLALGWMRAAVAKLLSSTWWDGTELREFAATHSADSIDWYGPFLTEVLVPLHPVVSILVVAMQLTIALAFITGVTPPIGTGLGLFLSVNFVLAGAPNPGVFYLVLHVVLLLWWFTAYESSRRTIAQLRMIFLTSVALATAALPSVSTVTPEHVIDDPAMVLLSTSSVLAVSAFVAMTRQTRELERRRAPTPATGSTWRAPKQRRSVAEG